MAQPPQQTHPLKVRTRHHAHDRTLLQSLAAMPLPAVRVVVRYGCLMTPRSGRWQAHSTRQMHDRPPQMSGRGQETGTICVRAKITARLAHRGSARLQYFELETIQYNMVAHLSSALRAM